MPTAVAAAATLTSPLVFLVEAAAGAATQLPAARRLRPGREMSVARGWAALRMLDRAEAERVRLAEPAVVTVVMAEPV